MHINKRVLAGGIVARYQDRIGVAGEANVWQGVVLFRSRDRQLAARIISRYGCWRGRAFYCHRVLLSMLVIGWIAQESK
jgi:hypothetical protein